MAEYLRVVKLKEYQHYKDRNPSWVKLHSQILTSRTWVTLDDHSRVLMVVCMVIAASTGNKIPLDPAYIRRAAYLDHDPDFTALIDVGFVEVVDEVGNPVRNASKAYATLAERTECLQSVSNARPEERRGEEKRAEKKTPCTSAKASVLDDSTDVDPRHAPVRQLIQRLYLQQFRVKAEWDGSEAKALDRLLSGNPTWTTEQLGWMVENRFASEDITSARPRKWISSLGGYMAGPLDRYGRIKAKPNGANGSMSDHDRLFGPTSLMARVKAEVEGQ